MAVVEAKKLEVREEPREEAGKPVAYCPLLVAALIIAGATGVFLAMFFLALAASKPDIDAERCSRALKAVLKQMAGVL